MKRKDGENNRKDEEIKGLKALLLEVQSASQNIINLKNKKEVG